MTPFTCLIPMRTVAEGNAREHWRVRHKRRKREAATVELCTSWPGAAGSLPPGLASPTSR
jgi:hypothetical protein